MKKYILSLVFLSIILVYSGSLIAQDNGTASIAPATSHGEDLDLTAVMTLFQESKDLEDFEKKLNEKDGVNNLDLNENGEVDYIRVVEQQKDNFRVIVLQAVLSENQSQDVAVINVEKKSEKEVSVQCEGNEDIYGPSYYVAPPPTVHVYVWPIWLIMFAPTYVVYRSPWHYHRYPPYWRGRPPVPYAAYHSRTVVVTNRGVYVHSRTAVVRRPPNVYHAHRSAVVVRKPPRHVNTINNNNVNRNNNVNKSNNVNRNTNTNKNNVNRNTNTNKNNNVNRNTNTNKNNNVNRNTSTNKGNVNRNTNTNRNNNVNRAPSTRSPNSRYKTGGGGRSGGGGGRRR